MDRRTFLTSSGAAAFGTLVPRISRFFPALNTSERFAWEANDLIFSFEVTAGKLRQKRLVAAGTCRRELTIPPVSKSHFNAAEKILPIKA